MFKGIKEIQHFVGETFDTRLRLFDISKHSDDKNQLDSWLLPQEKKELLAFKSELKSKQRKTSLALLAKDLGEPGLIIKEECGKPRVKNTNLEVSISHCDELIAYAIAPKLIGVDVHHYSEKTAYVASKFLNHDEKEYCLGHPQQPFIDLFWSVKEAVYKVYGSRLLLKEIKIDLASINSNELLCTVEGRGDTIKISFALHKTFCICLAELANS